MKSIGIDIGGTKVKCGVIENDVVIRADIINTICDINYLMKSIFEVVDLYFDEYPDIKYIGVGVTGQFSDGLLTSNVIGCKNYDIEGVIKKHYENVDVYSTNDATAATIAEMLYGNLVGVKNGLFMTLGTGIGGGFIFNGKLYEGSNKNAGEIGHHIIEKNGISCPSCKRKGCYEMYASTKALVERCKKCDKELEKSLIFSECNGKVSEIEGIHIFDAYDKGDMLAKSLVNEHLDYIAIGINNLINMLDFDRIVIGGGISKREDVILAGLITRISSNNFIDSKCDIKISKFFNDAGIIGAANLYKIN